MERRTTIPRWLALQAHWRRHPRPEWLIAGYLGFKPPAEAIERTAPAARPRAMPPTGEMQGLFQSLGGGAGKNIVVVG